MALSDTYGAGILKALASSPVVVLFLAGSVLTLAKQSLRLSPRKHHSQTNVPTITSPHLAGAMPLAPAIVLPHGVSPLPVLGDADHESLIYSLKHRVSKILGLSTPSQPRAIVLVTAHWATNTPAVSSGASHELIYDYGGFPPESFRLKYPAPGDPLVAREVKAALDGEGLQAQLDAKRGWDHGVFVPMMLVNPKADVPIIQVSVLRSEDPAMHLRMGVTLGRLRSENIAIIGSGFASLHNIFALSALRTLPPPQRTAFNAASGAWNAALTQAVTMSNKDDRWAGLERWRDMPYANKMHPPRGGEHFMPLIVCAGAAGVEEEAKYYKDQYLGVDIYTYYWGGQEMDASC